MRTTEACPICLFPGEVRDIGVFGYVAHCSECYEADPEAERWCRLQGHGAKPEAAVEAWLEAAREWAAVDEIPGLPIRFRLTAPLIASVVAQAVAELEAQRDCDKVEAWHWVPDHMHPEREREDIIYLEFPECT